jgi:putative ABC transport system permease protein
MHEQMGGQHPYDVWLATEPTAPAEEIIAGVRQLGITMVAAEDARRQIRDGLSRPERQGLFGLLSAGFVSAALLTVLGFLVFAVVGFQRRFVELGLLRALGLSVPQMAGYLAGEQAAIIGAGTGLGTAVGVSASRLFIPFLQGGSGHGPPVLPFVVRIAWAQLPAIYALLAAMFLVAVVALTLLLLRMKMFEAVKLGEAV